MFKCLVVPFHDMGESHAVQNNQVIKLLHVAGECQPGDFAQAFEVDYPKPARSGVNAIQQGKARRPLGRRGSDRPTKSSDPM